MTPHNHLPAPRRRGPSQWHFDIDAYLNPFLPPSGLPRLPTPIAHFLGYRTHAPRPVGNLAMIFWAVIGVFCSLAVIGAVVQAVPEFERRGVPTIIGSFGAAAVLDFYAIESPLAQPRNAVLGQLISALTGVSLCKLLSLAPHFPAVRWLGASLACACATALMALTGTVHPPAGATALMAVLDPDVAGLGWFLLLPLLLGCCLMLGVAVVVNNVQRRFPVYWWSPGEMGAYWRGRKGVVTEGEKDGQQGGKGEKEVEEESSNEGSSTAGSAAASAVGDLEAGGGGELATISSVVSGRGGEIVIRRGRVQIPEGLGLMPEEILALEMLSERL